ncbi:MAG: hypothetical protein ABIS86_03190, partial [Streptosporangiaceae bacterium]
MKIHSRQVVLSAAGLVAVAAIIGLPAVSAKEHQEAPTGQTLFTENFKGAGTTLDLWRSQSPRGGVGPCLTAATSPPAGSLPACPTARHDRPGRGAVQLTDNSRDVSGVLLLDRPIPTSAGLRISFDMFQYGRNTTLGADGMALFVVGGKQRRVVSGKPGGSLGYRGMKGGILGVGLDAFGGFSRPTSDGPDGPGRRRNSVVVRGAEVNGNRYLGGVRAPVPLSVATTNRSKARRTVVVELSPTGLLAVRVDFHDGKGSRTLLADADLNVLPGQPVLPPTVKLGFAAATGGQTDVHALSDLRVATLPPDLFTTVTPPPGPLKAGGSAVFTVRVGDRSNAGPASAPVSSTTEIPSPLRVVSATGPGWRCRTTGQRVACARQGRPLRPGRTHPPIPIRVSV